MKRRIAIAIETSDDGRHCGSSGDDCCPHEFASGHRRGPWICAAFDDTPLEYDSTDEHCRSLRCPQCLAATIEEGLLHDIREIEPEFSPVSAHPIPCALDGVPDADWRLEDEDPEE